MDPEGLRVYMPEEDVERVGVFPDAIRTFKADTLEELAEKLEINDVNAFVGDREPLQRNVRKGQGRGLRQAA